MEFSKMLSRRWRLKNSIAFLFVGVSVSCLLVVVISMLRLPEVSWESGAVGSFRALKIKKVFEEERLGELGDMMVGMLPDDLAFTVFVPSEKAFKRDLNLHVSVSLTEQKVNDTHAILSRILGFSAVPRPLHSVTVPLNQVVSFDSLSGFRLYISKDSDGMLMVNRVRSIQVNLRKKEIVVHVMNGVVMDAEFEQSVRPDYEDED